MCVCVCVGRRGKGPGMGGCGGELAKTDRMVFGGTGGSGVTVQERTYTVALTLRIPLVNLTSTARNEICESAQTAYNCGGGIQCNCTLGEDASGLSFIHAFIRHSSHLRQDSSRSGSSGTYTFIVVVVAVAPAETFT